MNKDDYIIEGMITTLIASEDLKFGDDVDYDYVVDRIKVRKAIIPFREHEYAGRVISDARKDEQVKVLLSGHIIPKKQETEYREKVKQELMLSIFNCIGDMFGYDVEAKKK